MAETTAPPRASAWLGGKWKGRPQSSLWRLLQARRDGDEDLERSESKPAPAASLLPHPTHPSCILEKLLLGTACSLPAHPNSIHSRWGPRQGSAQARVCPPGRQIWIWELRPAAAGHAGTPGTLPQELPGFAKFISEEPAEGLRAFKRCSKGGVAIRHLLLRCWGLPVTTLRAVQPKMSASLAVLGCFRRMLAANMLCLQC